MTVSAVTAGSSVGAVLGVGSGHVITDPSSAVSTAASALAFTGASHLAIEGMLGGLLVITGVLVTGLARRHRLRPEPAVVTPPPSEASLET